MCKTVQIQAVKRIQQPRAIKLCILQKSVIQSAYYPHWRHVIRGVNYLSPLTVSPICLSAFYLLAAHNITLLCPGNICQPYDLFVSLVPIHILKSSRHPSCPFLASLFVTHELIHQKSLRAVPGIPIRPLLVDISESQTPCQ